MQPSNPLHDYIQKRIAEIADGSSSLSFDGSALMVAGSIGFGAFVTPEGEAFVDWYTFDKTTGYEVTRRDRSRRGQVSALVLGMKSLPALAELLPPRADDATTCEACSGKGFTDLGIVTFKKQGLTPYLYRQCCGLGWISPDVFKPPMDEGSQAQHQWMSDAELKSWKQSVPSHWQFRVEEICAGGWRVTGFDEDGRQVSCEGVDPDELLRRSKEWAADIDARLQRPSA